MDTLRKPPWLTKRLTLNGTVQEVRTLMRKQSLHTVCESARCPNISECWSRKTATFLIGIPWSRRRWRRPPPIWGCATWS